MKKKASRKEQQTTEPNSVHQVDTPAADTGTTPAEAADRPTHISWNIVARGVRVTSLLQEKIRKRNGKFEKHLKRFPIDAVHLHIALEKNPGEPPYSAALSLRLPSTVLHAVKFHDSALSAFEEASDVLLRQLVEHKRDLRREAEWKRHKRRTGARPKGKPRFAPEPMAEGTGPQSQTDVMRDLAARHYRKLRQHVRRLLWHDAMAGEIPWGAIDDRAVVDESIEQALADPERKPRDLDFDLWLRHLIHINLERRRREWQRNNREIVSLSEDLPVPEDIDEADGYDAEQPLDIIEQAEEPPAVERADLTEDPSSESPAETVARHDLIDALRRVVSKWPGELREIFEMYYVEGLDPEDISLVIGRRADEVNKLLDEVQARLRETVLDSSVLA